MSRSWAECSPSTSPQHEPKRPRVAEEAHAFGFPFPPYDVQESLMKELYRCLDEGGIGVFESPTGTGKSLSLICSTLRWVLDKEAEDVRLANGGADASAAADADEEPSWVTEQSAAAALSEERERCSALAEARLARAQRVAKYKQSIGREHRKAWTRRPPKDSSGKGADGDDGDDDAPADAEKEHLPKQDWEEGAAASADADDDDDAKPEEAEKPRCRQVFYCSRTHSQLAQVVGEVKKTGYRAEVAVVSLGSRKALCINDSVRSLSSSERVNEACLELAQAASKAKAKGAPKRKGCPYRAVSEGAQRRLTDQLLSAPMDIEELAELGRAEETCPYYGARSAVAEAQLVALPYAALLNAGTREALSVALKGSVVIIDEAHNLIDTVNDMHSSTLSARHLSEVSAQLAQYEERYRNRLKPANRLLVQQLLYVTRALRRALVPGVAVDAPRAAAPADGARADGRGPEQPPTVQEKILGVNAFLCLLNIDNINLFRLRAFCNASEIAKKLRGFTDAKQLVLQHGDDAPGSAAAARGTLHGVIGLLEALTNTDGDARVLLHVEQPLQAVAAGKTPDSWLRVLHLNPAVYFGSLLREAHAIVLAGGTMQPFGDLRQQVTSRSRALTPARPPPSRSRTRPPPRRSSSSTRRPSA